MSPATYPLSQRFDNLGLIQFSGLVGSRKNELPVLQLDYHQPSDYADKLKGEKVVELPRLLS